MNDVRPTHWFSDMTTESQKILNTAINPNDPVESRIATIISQLTDYNKAMGPSQPIDSVTGAKYQKRLYNIMIDALRFPMADFIRIWDALLTFVHKHRTESFKIPGPFRFPESIPMTRRESKNFQRLILLVVKTANPATRAANLRQLSLDSTVQDLTGAQADKLRAFYMPS